MKDKENLSDSGKTETGRKAVERQTELGMIKVDMEYPFLCAAAGNQRRKRRKTFNYHCFSYVPDQKRKNGNFTCFLSKLHASGKNPYWSGTDQNWRRGNLFSGAKPAVDNSKLRSVFCGNSALGSENQKEKLYPMYELRKMQLVRGRSRWFCPVASEPVKSYKVSAGSGFLSGSSNGVVFYGNGVVDGVVEWLQKIRIGMKNKGIAKSREIW